MESHDDKDECPTDLDPLGRGPACAPPCTHTFHPTCAGGLRSYGTNQVCPVCREELPPGPE